MHAVYAGALTGPLHCLEILSIPRLKPGSSTALGVDTLCGPKEELVDAILRVVVQLEEEDDSRALRSDLDIHSARVWFNGAYSK